MARIVFLVSSMQAGGAERVASLLCSHWAAEGHEVTLLVTFSGRGDCVYPLHEAVRLEYLADHAPAGRGPLARVARLAALRRRIRAQRPDCVISFLTSVNVAAIMALRGTGIPLVVSERSYPPAMPTSRFWKVLRRLSYPRATRVAMQTGDGLEWLASAIPRARGTVIGNPVVLPLPASAPERAPADIVAPDRLVLLATGRLAPEKQFDHLLDAFAGLARDHDRLDLVILGEGGERRALERQRDRLGLAGRVHLPGHAGNPGDWYRRAEFFAMTSAFEGFPNALLEALAHGVAAVSYDCRTGPRDLIGTAGGGRLVPPENGPEGLRAALDEVIRAGGEAPAPPGGRVAEEFAIASIAKKWLEAAGIDG